jgi:DNA-directed RNA polymerase alpha subunit
MTLEYLEEVNYLVDKFQITENDYAFYLHEELNNIADDAFAILGSFRRRLSNLKSRLDQLAINKEDEIDWSNYFSMRVANALMSGKIKSIEEVKAKTDRELLKLKYFGRKSLAEVRERLRGIDSE